MQKQGETIASDLPRIRRARPGKAPKMLVVDWVGGGRDTVDLTGLIARYEAFAPLDDADEFAGVEVVNWGGGVAWACGVDYSADSLARLAEEQRPMTAAEFVRWQEKMNVSNREAADLLDRSLTTIKNYRSGAVEISLPVATTLRTMMHDPTVFVAHFRSRKPGRPRKTG